jgi:hypothetical protein
MRLPMLPLHSLKQQSKIQEAGPPELDGSRSAVQSCLPSLQALGGVDMLEGQPHL